jgi:hypothetical protein
MPMHEGEENLTMAIDALSSNKGLSSDETKMLVENTKL